jgi:hypothetical protein
MDNYGSKCRNNNMGLQGSEVPALFQIPMLNATYQLSDPVLAEKFWKEGWLK